MLAHGSGLDEMAVLLFPLVVGGGFWLLTRPSKPRPKDD